MSQKTEPKPTAYKALKYLLPLLLTFLWLGFIYSNSLQTGEQSGEQSGRVHDIVTAVTNTLGLVGISEHLIRKLAHFAEFAVLGGLLCIDIWHTDLISLKKDPYISLLTIFAAVPMSSILAGFDELLQTLSVGRGPALTDVLIDTAGAATATFLFAACYLIVYSKNKKCR